MAYAISALDDFIREELPRVIYESLPNVMPLVRYVDQTTDGVTRSGIGRGWQVIHLYGTGVAGSFEYSEPGGPAMVDLSAGASGQQVGILNFGTGGDLLPFPNANQSPHTSSLKRSLYLHLMTGNFSVPATWLQADALDSSQIKMVARDLKAVGESRALVEAVSFHCHSATAASGYEVDVLGRITAATEIGSTNFVKLTIDETYGRINAFRVGMSIDIVATSTDTLQDGIATDGTDVRNYASGGVWVKLYVTDVDYLGKTVTVAGVNTTTGAQAAYDGTNGWYGSGSVVPASGDWLVLARCSRYVAATRPMFTWGIEDWMKSSGTIMGGAANADALDLDVFSQFKSKTQAVSGPLTETVMNQYIGGYLDSYPGSDIDTLLTTMGVTLKFLEQPMLDSNRQVFDRTGKSLNMKGGWSDVGYSFNGREMRWIISPLCLSGKMYGFKLGGGNLKRYVPPSVGGKDARIGGEVEFLAPLGGHSGIFKIAHGSTGASEGVLEAPFWQYNLLAPVDPKGIILTSLTEATMS
jgi:hypothetical protein